MAAVHYQKLCLLCTEIYSRKTAKQTCGSRLGSVCGSKTEPMHKKINPMRPTVAKRSGSPDWSKLFETNWKIAEKHDGFQLILNLSTKDWDISTHHQWRSQPKNLGGQKIWGAKVFDFRRIALFCLEKRPSKPKMIMFSKNLGRAMAPLPPPWLLLCAP